MKKMTRFVHYQGGERKRRGSSIFQQKGCKVHEMQKDPQRAQHEVYLSNEYIDQEEH
jgi:hypothetical protein